MRVYFDTGVFIDFLTARGLIGASLRTAGRRGRSLAGVLRDVEHLLERTSTLHQGATSALTFYEVEEALYKSLVTLTSGLPQSTAYRVAAARSIVPQMVITTELFSLQVLELTGQTIEAQLRLTELRARGIRAADALHVASAAIWQADAIVTADEAILRLDKVIRNDKGAIMRCLDTDLALAIL